MNSNKNFCYFINSYSMKSRQFKLLAERGVERDFEAVASPEAAINPPQQRWKEGGLVQVRQG
jgi:hypothetical protein